MAVWEQVSVMFLFFFFPFCFLSVGFTLFRGVRGKFPFGYSSPFVPLWPFAIEIILIADVIMTSKNCIE